jgi:hypothetical protein
MAPVIEKGTIKVVWLEDRVENIYSKMFESESEAITFGRTKKDYLIFRLLWHKEMNEFSWELLPQGKFSLYKKLFRLYRLFVK